MSDESENGFCFGTGRLGRKVDIVKEPREHCCYQTANTVVIMLSPRIDWVKGK
jgi:hypothetical protein